MVTGVGDLVLGKEDYPTLTRLSYSLEKQSGKISIFYGNRVFHDTRFCQII